MKCTTRRTALHKSGDLRDILGAPLGTVKSSRNGRVLRDTLPSIEGGRCRQFDRASDGPIRASIAHANQIEYKCPVSPAARGRLLAAIVVLVGLARCAAGAEPTEVIKLWPGEPPGAKREIAAEQDLTKAEDRLIAGKPIIKLGNVTTPELHVFLPPEEKRNGTAVVILPGGGYHILAWDLEGTEVAEWLNSIGVAAMVLKYRVPRRAENPSEMAVQDTQRALSLVRSKAKDWGLAADRVGVLGFSAGGNAASLVAVNNAKRTYEAVDAVDEVAFRPDFGVIIYGAWMADDKTGELKPEFKPTKETPPMFFAHAADDGVKCESSVAMFLALKNLGIPSELHVYDAGGHGYGLRHDEQFPVTTWPARCTEWFARHGWLKNDRQ